jgi:preprotein translocase subunit SecG
MFSTILLILFIPICILLILIVLLQAGKGGGLAGAFGGAGAQTFLGARGAVDFLSKLTIYLAIGFMALALILSLTYGGRRGIKVEEEIEAPAAAGTSTEEAPPAESGTTQESAPETSQPTPSPDEGSKTPPPEGTE